jgi:hypothetical protein
MSAMKNTVIEIENAIEECLLSFPDIAAKFGVTIKDVCLISEELDRQYEHESMLYEAMDGDHDSAMASAGFGTDEDYGYYGEE